MKTNLFTLIALVCVVLFSGCKKDDDAQFNYDLDMLYGKWRITSLYSSGKWVDVTTYPGSILLDPTYATFYKDGTYYGSGEFGNGSGTYKAIGNSVTTYVDGKEYVRYDIISLSASICELNMVAGSSSLKVKCTKQ